MKKSKLETLNSTHNILNEELTAQVMSEVFDQVTSTLSKTLGPYGKSGLVSGHGQAFISTKDGYTAIQNIKYLEQERAMVLDALRNISRLQVSQVGDGSTSTVIIANSMYKAIMGFKKEHNVPTNTILLALNEMKDQIIENITEYSTLIPEKMEILEEMSDEEVEAVKVNNNKRKTALTRVATISTNNDDELGEMIASLYDDLGQDGRIGLEKSRTNNTYSVKTQGYGLEKGFISPEFVTDPKLMIAEYDNPVVYMIEGMFCADNIQVFERIFNKYVTENYRKTGKVRPIVIVASEFDHGMLNTALINSRVTRMENFPVVAIQVYRKNKSNDDDTVFGDLSVYLGVKPLRVDEDPMEFNIDLYDGDNPDNEGRLGSCGSIVVKENESIFLDGNGPKDDVNSVIGRIENHIKNIEDREDTETDYTFRLGRLRMRILRLQGNTGKIFVGAPTSIEVEAKWFLVEDGILAVRQALHSGTVPGGNLSLLKAVNEINLDTLSTANKYMSKKAVMSLKSHLAEACSASYIKVHQNRNDMVKIKEVQKYIDRFLNDGEFYNMVTEVFEKDENISVLNAAKSEITIITTVISIISLLADTAFMLVGSPRRDISAATKK